MEGTRFMRNSPGHWLVPITQATSLVAIGWLLTTQVYATGDTFVRWLGSFWSLSEVAVILAIALGRYRFRQGCSVRVWGLRLPIVPNYTRALQNNKRASPLWSVMVLTAGAALADSSALLARLRHEHGPNPAMQLSIVTAVCLSVNAAQLWVQRLAAAEIEA